MTLKGRKIIIACQAFIILAFFAGMLLNYFTLQPIIDIGEMYRLTTAIDPYRNHLYPDNGCDPHDKEQLEKTLSTVADPLVHGELFLADSQGCIIYSWNGSEGDIRDVLEEDYGLIAKNLLLREYESPAGRQGESKMEYDKKNKYSLYANFSPSDDLMFFYAVDYRLVGNKLLDRFFFLMMFMIVAGICVVAISFLIGRKIIRQEHTETLVQQELDTAARLQKQMLPREDKHMMQIDVNARLIPARKVGGDFYYHILRKGILYFCIGDVSGKGIPASIFMSKAVTLFRSYANSIKTPVEIASSMNEELCVNNDASMFLTAIVGAVNVYDGRMSFVNAGHVPPIIWNGNEESGLEVLKTKSNIPLGLIEDSEYEEEEYELQKNGMMLFYTDGVSEAKSWNKGYMKFNILLRKLQPFKSMSAKDINDHLLRLVSEFEMGSEQSDDITLLTFRNTPGPKNLSIKNDIQELKKIAPFVEQILKECPLDRKGCIRLRSGLDEALTNCVLYAYDTPGNTIDVSAYIKDRKICFLIKDSGKAFNPLEYEKEPSLELMPGGLGISMMKEIFDEVRYKRENDKNILELIKQL